MEDFEKKIKSTLKTVWGYSSLRPLQQNIITNCLAGKNQLAILPTGAGKSICFQIPALILEGICLVISPLIALMKDQVENLKQKGINAEAIFSGMHPAQIDRILDNCAYGDVKFLYISPERLKSELFLARVQKMNVNLIAIDEAHCIAQWGHDFRPAYLEIKQFLENYPTIPKLALTASATHKVQKEIIEELNLKQAVLTKGSLTRDNLSYQIINTEQKEKPLISKLFYTKGSKIIYVNTRKRAETMASWLFDQGYKASFYHAGLDQTKRNIAQADWVNNKTDIIVATNAFGMGIDKPDVRLVVHFDLPPSIEAYYQEAGRAGRDGQIAEAILLHHPFDGPNLIKKINEENIATDEIKRVYQALANYLKLAVGSAMGESYPLDLKSVGYESKIEQKLLTKAIKKLQQLGFIELSETSNPIAQVKLKLNQGQLYNFTLKYPNYEFIIKSLMRVYGGNLVHEFQNLNESKLAKFLNIPETEIKQNLNELAKLDVFDYIKASQLPKLTYLTPRQAAENMVLDETKMQKLNKIKLNQAQEIIGFVAAQNCRSNYIQEYFGDNILDKCGICDLCLPTTNDIETLKLDILAVLKEGPISITNLKNKMYHAQLGIALRELVQQEKVIVQDNDLLMLRTI